MENDKIKWTANTLFHFTNNIENILNILENGFKPHFTLENLNFLRTKEEDYKMAIAMNCFCDLPLSKIKNHINVYGNYGIGFKKDWGIKLGISPVLYLNNNSKTAKLMRWTLEKALDDKNKSKILKNTLIMICMLKKYEGYFKKNEYECDKYRFYDEREWRYIPYEIDDELLILSEEELAKLDNKYIEDKNKKLVFKPNDIKFIIVKNDNEIIPIYEQITNLTKYKYTTAETQKLTTRIISCEHIEEDF